jgi:hypothetical protein
MHILAGVTFTDQQWPRVLAACGIFLDLGRDALEPDVSAYVFSHLKDITLSIEKNKAVAAANGPSWDVP